MTNVGAPSLTQTELIQVTGLAALVSIGDQQAHMAFASLGFNTRRGQTVEPGLLHGNARVSVDIPRFPRLGSARRRDPADKAEQDNKCPYCSAAGTLSRAQPLGNLTRLEGSCPLCGAHTLRLVA